MHLEARRQLHCAEPARDRLGRDLDGRETQSSSRAAMAVAALRYWVSPTSAGGGRSGKSQRAPR